MKKSRSLFFASAVFAVLVYFLVRSSMRSPEPVLEFQGYGRSTNGSNIVKLLLRNTTQKDLWIINSGENFPLEPPVIKRWEFNLPPESNSNVYSVRVVMHYFYVGERLSPSHSLAFELPIRIAEQPEQIGITYYTGNFKDGNDLIGYTWTPPINSPSSISEKAKVYLIRIKHWWKAPKRHEVWCPEWLSLPKENKTNSTADQILSTSF